MDLFRALNRLLYIKSSKDSIQHLVNNQGTSVTCSPAAGSGGDAVTVSAECLSHSEHKGTDKSRGHHDLRFLKNIRYDRFGALEQKCSLLYHKRLLALFNSEPMLLWIAETAGIRQFWLLASHGNL